MVKRNSLRSLPHEGRRNPSSPPNLQSGLAFFGMKCHLPSLSVDRPEIWGHSALAKVRLAGRSGQIDAQNQRRAFRCRPRNELGAAVDTLRDISSSPGRGRRRRR